MTRRSFSLLIVSVLLLGGAFFARNLSGQSHAASFRTWPPPPSDIVNLNGFYSMSAGGSQVLFTVPANQWFVVTDAEILWHTGASIDLCEDAGGTITLKRSSWFNGWEGHAASVTAGPYRSAVGLSFAPGTKVVLVNPQSQGENGEFHLTGYLSNP